MKIPSWTVLFAVSVAGCSPSEIDPSSGQLGEAASSPPVIVTAPVSAATVSSPLWVRAHASACQGAAPTTFGYSIDDQAALISGGTPYDIDTQQVLSNGPHTIHFKASSPKGDCAVVSSTFTVETITSDLSVTSPAEGSSQTSPVLVSASVSECNGTPTTAFAYSVDDQTTLTLGTPNAIHVEDASITPGTHTLHFKAWAGGTLCPVVDRSITVTGGGSGGAFTIPSNAIADHHIEQRDNWAWNHDPGTPGSSSGTSTLQSAIARDGEARKFSMTYDGAGGEIYHVSFDSDENATHFVYDNWIYIEDTSDLDNLELDLNQVVSNGDTIIYAFQCAGTSGTWEYGENEGTRAKSHSHWVSSNVKCDPQTWAAKTWHHVQVAYHRDDAGNATYEAVALDGVVSQIDATVFAAASLGWGKVLQTQFQIDGKGASGGVTAYADNLTVYRW
jgi:hypothetical protein